MTVLGSRAPPLEKNLAYISELSPLYIIYENAIFWVNYCKFGQLVSAAAGFLQNSSKLFPFLGKL